MKDSTPNPGQGTGGKGIFSTPFGNAVTGNNPIASNGTCKPYDYGNATNGFTDITYSEKGQGIIQGPGTATGDQKR